MIQSAMNIAVHKASGYTALLKALLVIWAGVIAFDAAGNASAPSSTVSATTPAAEDTTPPTAPSLTGTAVSTSEIDLSWTAATDDSGIAGYDVYRDEGWVTTLGATELAYRGSGLTPGTSYSYYVVATDGAGNVAASNTVQVATLAETTPTLPAAPSTVVAEQKGPAIQVTWTDNATDESWSEVHQSVVSDDGTTNWINVSGQLAADTTRFRDDTAASGVTYIYKVVVHNAAGYTESDPSNPATAR